MYTCQSCQKTKKPGFYNLNLKKHRKTWNLRSFKKTLNFEKKKSLKNLEFLFQITKKIVKT